jgi:hypothetical protein
MISVGDKVYLEVPKPSFRGVVHPKDQAFFVVGRAEDGRLLLSLTPQGSLVLRAFEDELTLRKPPTSVYDHIMEDDE